MWEKAIPTNQRILKIEEGIAQEYVQTINSNDIDIPNKTFGLLQSANDEILVVFSTSNAFHKIKNDWYFQKLKEIKDNKHWLALEF